MDADNLEKDGSYIINGKPTDCELISSQRVLVFRNQIYISLTP